MDPKPEPEIFDVDDILQDLKQEAKVKLKTEPKLEVLTQKQEVTKLELIKQQHDARQKLYIMYHCPCIDGIFSLMNLTMTFRTKIAFQNWTLDGILDRIEQHLQHLINKTEDPYKAPEEKEIPTKLSKDFFRASFSDQIVFFPIKFGIDKEEAFKLVKDLQGNQNYKDSTIILLDYFGRCFKALDKIAQLFKYMIIVDHHSTGFTELANYEGFNHEMKTIQHVKGNVFTLMDEDRAGCELSMALAEAIFAQPYEKLVPGPLWCHQSKFIKHISDHDLYLLKMADTEPLIMAIFERKFNFRVNQNQNMFYELYDLDFVESVKQGRILVKQRNAMIGQMLPQKRKILIGGFKGYCIMSNNPKIINEIGLELANQSERDGQHNIAAVYHTDSTRTKLKVHLRSSKKSKAPVMCDLLAEQFKGGGHKNAASFTMDEVYFQKMIDGQSQIFRSRN